MRHFQRMSVVLDDAQEVDSTAQALAEFVRDRWGFERVDADASDDGWIAPTRVLLRLTDLGAEVDPYCSAGLEHLRSALARVVLGRAR